MSPSDHRHPLAPPSPWVRRFASSLPESGRVLDLACGAGRHTRLLLEAGHPVLAVDRDLSGVEDLRDEPGVELVEKDLETGAPWSLGREFGAIVVTNYLWRPILPDLPSALAVGGVLIYETFAAGNERFGRPSNPDFLLQPGELLELCRGKLEVVAYEQGAVETPKPAVVQRLCARRPGEGEAPPRLPPG